MRVWQVMIFWDLQGHLSITVREVYIICCYLSVSRNIFRIYKVQKTKNAISPKNHACEVTSDFMSPSAAPSTCAAYCKFQSTSSTEGREEASGDKHLAAMDITMDRDSCEQVARTIGSSTWSASSFSLSDVICNLGISLLASFSYTLFVQTALWVSTCKTKATEVSSGSYNRGWI